MARHYTAWCGGSPPSARVLVRLIFVLAVASSAEAQYTDAPIVAGNSGTARDTVVSCYQTDGLSIGYGNNGGLWGTPTINRAYLTFDISSVPANVSLSSVELKLNVLTTSSSLAINAYGMSDPMPSACSDRFAAAGQGTVLTLSAFSPRATGTVYLDLNAAARTKLQSLRASGASRWTIGLAASVQTYSEARFSIAGTTAPQLHVAVSTATDRLPAKAISPSPSLLASGVSVTTQLGWSNGGWATSYDVFFGLSEASLVAKGNRTSNAFDPGPLNGMTRYYWRIDPKNSVGTTKGDVWSFTTGACTYPARATSPSPATGSAPGTAPTSLSWTGSSAATSYDVRLGTTDPPPLKANQTSTTYSTGTLQPGTTYYWRVDPRNHCGATSGTPWSFTTPGSAGTVLLTVKDPDGGVKPGALCRLYSGTSQYGPVVTADTGGVCTWTGVGPGSYTARTFSTSVSPFPGEELWDEATFTLATGESKAITSTRRQPYVESVELRRGSSTGELLDSTKSVNPGDTIWAGVRVKQTTASTMSVRVSFVADLARDRTFDVPARAETLVVGSGLGVLFERTFDAPGADGTYAYALLIESLATPTAQKTDGRNWTDGYRTTGDLLLTLLGNWTGQGREVTVGATKYLVFELQKGTNSPVRLPFQGDVKAPSANALIPDAALGRLVLAKAALGWDLQNDVDNYLLPVAEEYGGPTGSSPGDVLDRTWQLAWKRRAWRAQLGHVMLWSGKAGTEEWIKTGNPVAGLAWAAATATLEYCSARRLDYSPSELFQQVPALIEAAHYFGQPTGGFQDLLNRLDSPDFTSFALGVKIGKWGTGRLKDLFDLKGLVDASDKAWASYSTVGGSAALDAYFESTKAVNEELRLKNKSLIKGTAVDVVSHVAWQYLGFDRIDEEVQLTTALIDAHSEAIALAARYALSIADEISMLEGSGPLSTATYEKLEGLYADYAYIRDHLIPALAAELAWNQFVHLKYVADAKTLFGQWVGATAKNVRLAESEYDVVAGVYRDGRFAEFDADRTVWNLHYENFLSLLAAQQSNALLRFSLQDSANIVVNARATSVTPITVTLFNDYASPVTVSPVGAIASDDLVIESGHVPTIAPGSSAEMVLHVTAPAYWFTLHPEPTDETRNDEAHRGVSHLVSIDVPLKWMVGGNTLERTLRLPLMVQPVERFQSIDPDRRLYRPGDRATIKTVHQVAAGEVIATLLLTPDGSPQSIGIGDGTFTYDLGAGPYGAYGVKALAKYAPGNVSIPVTYASRVFYLVPTTTGHLSRLNMTSLRVVFAPGDVEAADTVSSVLDLGADRSVCAQTYPLGSGAKDCEGSAVDTEPIATTYDTIIIGGPEANPLTRLLVERGQLAASLGKPGDAIITVVPNAFGSRTAVVVAGYDVPETEVAAMGLLADLRELARPAYTLSTYLSGTGVGAVTSNPTGIACGSDCSQEYAAATVVTLTATPAADSVFAAWSGDCSGAGICQVTLDVARSVTARFDGLQLRTITVQKQGTGAGTVVSDPPAIYCGAVCSAQFTGDAVVTLTAVPSPGSSFTGWGPPCSSTATNCTVPAHTASTTATFQLMPANLGYEVSVTGVSVPNGPEGYVTGSLLGAAYDESTDRFVAIDHIWPDGPVSNRIWVLVDAAGQNGLRPNWVSLPSSSDGVSGPYGWCLSIAGYDRVSNRLVVYCRDDGSTWVVTEANGLGGVPKWQSLDVAGPTNGGASGAFDSVHQRLIVFGGYPQPVVTVLSNATGTGGTPAWTTLEPLGQPPSPRAWSHAAYDAASNCLIIAGGWRWAVEEELQEVWLLTNANGLGGTPEWRNITPGDTTDQLWGLVALAYDANKKTAFAIGHLTWALEHADTSTGSPRWVQVGWVGDERPQLGAQPVVNYGYSAAYRRAVVVGNPPSAVWQLQFGGGELGDTSEPWVRVASHSDAQVVTTPTILLQGTASDAGRGDNGIAAVWVSGARASGGTAPEGETAQWSQLLNLVPGTNAITVIAVDGASPPNTATTRIQLIYTPETVGGAVRFAAASLVVPESAGMARVCLTRTAPAAGMAAVTVSAQDGSAQTGEDYWPVTETLWFPENATGPICVTIPVLDDGLAEQTEQFTVAIRDVTGASLTEPRQLTVALADDDSSGGTSNREILVVRDGRIQRLDEEGMLRGTIPTASEMSVYQFDVSDDGQRVVYSGGGGETAEVWVHEVATGQNRKLFSQPWSQNIKWLPGSSTRFVLGADPLYVYDLETGESAVWQATDTEQVFGVDNYRGGIEWDSAFERVLLRAGINGGGGDRILLGRTCQRDTTHSVCDLQAVTGPGYGWDEVTWSPAITSTGDYAYYIRRVQGEDRLIARRRLPSVLEVPVGDEEILAEVPPTGGYGLTSLALYDDSHLIYGHPADQAGVHGLYLCDVSPFTCRLINTNASTHTGLIRVFAQGERLGSDLSGPAIAVTSHADGEVVSMPVVSLAGTATDAGLGSSGISRVLVGNGEAWLQAGSGPQEVQWRAVVTLSPGSNTVPIVVIDGSPAANTTTHVLRITWALDNQGPDVRVVSPTNGYLSANPTLVLQGVASDLNRGQSGISAVTVNGRAATLGSGGDDVSWSSPVNLAPGDNWFAITATDGSAARNRTSVRLMVVYQAGLGILPPPAITAPFGGEVITVAGVTFRWTRVEGATGYGLRIIDRESAITVYSGSLVGRESTSALIGLPSGQYTFSVRACVSGIASFTCGQWSSADFAVDLTTPSDAPVVTAPGYGEVLTQSTTAFRWTGTAEAVSYEVVIEDILTNTIASQITVPATETSTIITLPAGSYEIRVRSCASGCGPTSTPVPFVMALPGAPEAAPEITATSLDGNQLTLSWTDVANADLYQVQIVQPNSGPGGGALTVAARQVAETSTSFVIPTGLAYAIVSACTGNGCGPASAAVAVDSRMANSPVPQIGSPMSGTYVSGPTVVFGWSRVPTDNGSNTWYRLYVQDMSRASAALDVYTRDNFYGAYLKAEGSRYDAIVVAYTADGGQVQGPPAGFVVVGTSAQAPTMVAPAHQSSVRAGNVQLGWSPVPGATLYNYFVAVLGQPYATVQGVTKGLFVQVPLSQPGILYSAIVRACPAGNMCTPDSEEGWGPWSVNAGPGVTNFWTVP